MSKTLVVSDNEFINILYVMNLEVYLATNTKLVSSYNSAIYALQMDDTFDLIVTLESIGNEKVGKNLKDFIKLKNLAVPLIVAGNSQYSIESEAVHFINGKFNIQNILKRSAKILGITAKQMAELDIGAYYPVPLNPNLGLTTAPCHIYQKSGSNFKLLVRQTDEIGETLTLIKENGVDHIYVSSADRLTMINKISLTLIEKITLSLKNLEGASIDKKVQVLSDGYEFAAANLFSNDEIKQQMQEIATASAKIMQDVSKESTTLKTLLATMLNNKDGYVFTHSMITSYVCYHMIKNVTWGGEGQTDKINFVIFFHDIFLAPIYLKYPELTAEALLLDNDKLTDKEKDIVLNHAKLAAELVVGYKRCPMGADTLIKQHHGMKKGKGFVKFYMEDLSPLSKVVLIAEMYVEEFLKSSEDPANPFNPKIVIPKLINEFKTPSYTKIVQTLVNVPL